MKPENRALVNALVAVVVVTSFVGGYLLLAPTALASTLPIRAGTTFTANDTATWVAHFSVGPSGGRLVGAWTAYTGSGIVRLVVVNGTVSKPPEIMVACPLMYSWTESNGTVNTFLPGGPYTVYWSTGFCSYASRIVVTQPIQVAA